MNTYRWVHGELPQEMGKRLEVEQAEQEEGLVHPFLFVLSVGPFPVLFPFPSHYLGGLHLWYFEFAFLSLLYLGIVKIWQSAKLSLGHCKKKKHAWIQELLDCLVSAFVVVFAG